MFFLFVFFVIYEIGKIRVGITSRKVRGQMSAECFKFVDKTESLQLWQLVPYYGNYFSAITLYNFSFCYI